MEVKRYNSNGRFHEAVECNGVLYLSGQVATTTTGIEQQAEECLNNLKKTLEKYNSDKKHILSATVYLSDMSYFDGFNKVWDQWFEEGTQPVRTCVAAKLAGPQYLIEITLIATTKQ